MIISKHLKHALVCPTCYSELSSHENSIVCDSCGKVGNINNGVLNFISFTEIKSQPAFYNNEDYKKAIEKIKQLHDTHYNPNSIAGKLESYFKDELLKIVINPQRPFFDIGCGTGTAFKHLGYPEEIIGIDISFELVQACKRDFPKADCICCDINKPPLKQQSLKTVFSIAILEHVFYLDSFLESIERLLSNDGFFYVLIPMQGGLAWSMLQNLAHFRYSRKLNINYKNFIEKEHCNSASAIESALNKFFIIDLDRKIPWRIGGYNSNLIKLYRLKKRINSVLLNPTKLTSESHFT